MLRNEIQNALTSAMKEKNAEKVSAIRMIVAGIKNHDVVVRGKGGKESNNEDILGLMQSMIKQRTESYKIYEDAGRSELAAKEKSEIEIIETFLPKQLSEKEIEELIKKLIEKTGSSSMKDMGKIMAELKANYVGQLDFSIASKYVKDLLS